MKDHALILAGGGAKGAYQIGVWKALRGFGADKLIGGVSGTSVGALNGALYVTGEYRKAVRVWSDIRHDDILTPSQVKQDMDKSEAFLSLFKKEAFSWVKSGVFSREGLSSIIRDNLNFKAIRKSPLPFYVTLFNKKTFSAEYFSITSDASDEYIEKLLLASSAIPFVFPSEEIGGNSYYDGGVVDNCPIKPLYKDGFRKFIVVWLSHDVSVGKLEHSLRFPDAEIIDIIPSEDQGNFLTGTLDFSRSGIAGRIDLGYKDAVRVLCDHFADSECTAVSSEKLDEMRKFSAKRSIRSLAKNR